MLASTDLPGDKQLTTRTISDLPKHLLLTILCKTEDSIKSHCVIIIVEIYTRKK